MNIGDVIKMIIREKQRRSFGPAQDLRYKRAKKKESILRLYYDKPLENAVYRDYQRFAQKSV